MHDFLFILIEIEAGIFGGFLRIFSGVNICWWLFTKKLRKIGYLTIPKILGDHITIKLLCLKGSSIQKFTTMAFLCNISSGS